MHELLPGSLHFIVNVKISTKCGAYKIARLGVAETVLAARPFRWYISRPQLNHYNMVYIVYIYAFCCAPRRGYVKVLKKV